MTEDDLLKCRKEGCKFTSEFKRGISSHHVQKHGESISGVEYECENCGDKFRAKDREYKTYCSRKCMSEDYKTRDDIGNNPPETGKGEEHPRYVEKEEMNCEECGRSFQYYPYQEEREYCSRECAYKGVRKRKTVNCKKCGEEFEKIPSDGPYCSYGCAMEDRDQYEEDKWEVVECEYCNKEFEAYKNYNRKYCSNECMDKNRVGRELDKETKRKIAESSLETFKDNNKYIEELGHRVRSTWEEDVGWFLYENNIDYQYEPDYFDVGGSYYVPDFIVGDKVIEVKGYCKDKDETKAREFMDRYPKYTYIVVGDSNTPHDICLGFQNDEYKDKLIQKL